MHNGVTYYALQRILYAPSLLSPRPFKGSGQGRGKNQPFLPLFLTVKSHFFIVYLRSILNTDMRTKYNKEKHNV